MTILLLFLCVGQSLLRPRVRQIGHALILRVVSKSVVRLSRGGIQGSQIFHSLRFAYAVLTKRFTAEFILSLLNELLL